MEYSLLDGACRLDRLMEKAHALEFPPGDHGSQRSTKSREVF